jgi:large subunit ribosomal protein L30
MKTLEIRQVRSAIGCPEKQRRVLRSLGLGKLHRPVHHLATPQILGMLDKVRHLVDWTEREDG